MRRRPSDAIEEFAVEQMLAMDASSEADLLESGALSVRLKSRSTNCYPRTRTASLTLSIHDLIQQNELVVALDEVLCVPGGDVVRFVPDTDYAGLKFWSEKRV